MTCKNDFQVYRSTLIKSGIDKIKAEICQSSTSECPDTRPYLQLETGANLADQLKTASKNCKGKKNKYDFYSLFSRILNHFIKHFKCNFSILNRSKYTTFYHNDMHLEIARFE